MSANGIFVLLLSRSQTAGIEADGEVLLDKLLADCLNELTETILTMLL